MNISASTQWSFRPAQMPEDMFLKTFVGRKKEIDMIFNHINFNLIPSMDEGNRKNMLIKSARGIGKTSLFLAIKYKLKSERFHMLKRVIPVFFNEQEDFNTVEKLIMRIYEILLNDAVLLDFLSQPGKWKGNYNKTKNNIKKSFDILKENLVSEEKKLVLFIENFDALVYRFLRRKGSKKSDCMGSGTILNQLINDPDILLICSAIDDPETPHDYSKETFKTIELEPVDDFYELIITRARYDNNLFLLANKEKLKNKIMAFKYLTGSNTRLMVHLYECLVEKDINKLEFMLSDMLNKSTPLFEWIIERFLDYESREILNALAKRGGNATVREIAQDTFNSESSVRTLLNRLNKKQFVEKINEKRDKSDIYIMVPMMFFIWYQKCVLQSKDVILDFFIHFVDLFFDRTELKERKALQQVSQKKEKETDIFSLYFNYVKKYVEEGKFPLKSSDEKREDEPTERDYENEKMVYELVRARKDDKILQTQVHRAMSLKAEKKLSESANLFRVAARGYLILEKELEESFIDKAEENIRRAIEIYQSIKTEPLETVRCLLILVEILSDTKRKEELRLFAHTIIRIGKKSGKEVFFPYSGLAYKYLGFAETDFEKKLEMFNISLGYFEKVPGEQNQIIILLVNIGLTYKAENRYETALEYFEKSLVLSRRKGYSSLLNSIIFSIFEIFIISRDFYGGLKRINEVTKWIEDEQYEVMDLGTIFWIKAFFSYQNEEFYEAEKFFQKSIAWYKNEKNHVLTIPSLFYLALMYSKLNKKVKAEKLFGIIEKFIKESQQLTPEDLGKIGELFLKAEYFEKAIFVFEQSHLKYQELKDIKGQALAMSSIGFCYNKKGDFDNAEENYKKAIDVFMKNKLEELSYPVTINYSTLLLEHGRIDEAIKILEDYEAKGFSMSLALINAFKMQLFVSYIRKVIDLYEKKNIDNALVFIRKALKHIDYLSIEDFVNGFYFNLVLPLIDLYGGKTYSFFKEIDLYLSEFYEDKDRGDFIKLFKLVIELVKGEDFGRLTKDLDPTQRKILELIKERLEKDAVLEEVDLLIFNGELDEAANKLEKSLEENEKDIKKLKKLAEVYKRGYQKGKYFQVLQKIISFCPDDRETLLKLSYYYIENNENDEAEKILISLKGRDPQDADALYDLGFLFYRKKNFKRAIECFKDVIKYSKDDKRGQVSKLTLPTLFFMEGSDQSIQEALNILKDIRTDKYDDFKLTFRYYFLNVIFLLFIQNKTGLKNSLSSLLYVQKDSSVIYKPPVREEYLLESLKERLSNQDFVFVVALEKMMMNEISVSSFVNKFADYIDEKMVQDITEELIDSGKEIIDRVLKENITGIDKIVEICGTRIRFESLLYNIKEKFPGLTVEQQHIIMSILIEIIGKLSESYKWMVLDFSALYLNSLDLSHQSSLIDAFLKLLKEGKGSNSFFEQIKSFLQTAKSVVDETLREKIEKELIKIQEVKK